MAVAKLKPPPSDPLRVQLQEAIENTAAARAALERHKQAVTKTRSARYAAERNLETAKQGEARAPEDHAAAIAASMVSAQNDDEPLPPSQIRLARLAVADLEAEVEALKLAYRQLVADAGGYEANVRECEIAIEAAISEILRRPAEQLLAKLHAKLAELAPIRAEVLALRDAHSPVGFAVDFLAIERGRQPLAAVFEDAGRAYFAVPIGDAAVTNPWLAARARLRADPDADLADLLALPASPPRPPAA